MKIVSTEFPDIWYEIRDGNIDVHDEKGMVSTPIEMAHALKFNNRAMVEINKVIEGKSKCCEVCGRPFVSYRSNANACSDKCKRIRRTEQQRGYRRKKPKRKSQLVAAENEARAKGMSYGQYKALETIEKYGRVKV